MRLHLLGTGVPDPSLKRVSSGYVVRTGDDVIVFDHGPGAYQRLMEVGVNCTDVTHVFITHLHYDHCVDLIRLFLNRWDMAAGRLPPLKIHGPPGLQKFMDRLFGPDGAFADDLIARTRHPTSVNLYHRRGGTGERALPQTGVIELSEGDTVEGDNWRLSLASVPHVQPYLPCYAYRLEADDGVFAYSGDCGPCEAMHTIARNADVLVQMCVRMENPGSDLAAMPHRAAAELARDAGVRTLVASHFPIETDRDGIRERTIAEMGEIYAGTLIWGEDGMEIPIRRNE